MNTISLTAPAVLIGALLALTPFVSFADHSVPQNTVADVPATTAEHETHGSECSVTRDLSVGSRGEDVECLQHHLMEDGFLKIGGATGYFGEMTKTAVQKWQEEKGLPATGYVGPLSRAALASHATPVTSSHAAYKAMEDSHKAMMAAFMSTSSSMAMAMPDNRKVIAVVLYDEFEPLDAVGPLEVLGQLQGYKVVTVAKQKGAVASAFGTKMIADYSFDELKHPAIIVVPGGLFGTIAASKDPETLAWLREADKTSEYTTSVCTGSWILAAAGLLNGREASTHWTGADYLEDFGVKYSDKRYTVDGKYITGAGVSAGIDMSFKLVAMLEGDDRAKVAQLGLEYDPQPPFDAGSPAKADPVLVKIMRDMMDDHIQAAKMMHGTSTTAMTMSHDIGTDMHMSTGSDSHAHGAIDVASWPAKPSVNVIAHLDGTDGWILEVRTEHFRFAPEKAGGLIGGVAAPNEGHAHLYIDGKKIARLYGPWYSLPKSALSETGPHEILVTLSTNSHSELQYAGQRIEAKVTVNK
jgi:putative intracellular protease/amidase